MKRAIPISKTAYFAVSGIVAFLMLIVSSAYAVSDSFQPLSVTLQPKLLQSTLPSWAVTNPAVDTVADSVEIPVPALASQDVIGCFALTVVFQDNGDGGPVVEWQPKEGDRVLLSAGLGENGVALGLNSRTLLLTQSLALDGGTIRVSFAGRFTRLISVTLRPAREMGIAALGADFSPALLGSNEAVLTQAEVSGSDVSTPVGDQTEASVVHAELLALPKQLDATNSGGTLEFVLPLGTLPQGSLIQTDIGGLDPESWIEVAVNGESFGALGAAPFSLNSPSVIFSDSGRLLVAGWSASSLYLPARLWKQGDNSIVLTLHRVSGDEGAPIYLRKTKIDLLFSPHPAPAASSANNSPTPVGSCSSSDTLSTGSHYGNPSPSLFHVSPPLLNK